MFRKCSLLVLLVFTASVAFAQGTPASSTQSDKGQKKPETDTGLGSITSAGLSQNVVPASELSNSELLARSRSIYVTSDTVFVKREDMEKYLLRQKELEEFRLHVVKSKQDADLILQIKRVPFTNNFPIRQKKSWVSVGSGSLPRT